MTPGNVDIKYKNFSAKLKTRQTFPDLMIFLIFRFRKKKHSGKLVMVWSVMMLCLTLFIGIYFYQAKPYGAGVSKNETASFQDMKTLVWEWKSPTQQLLSPALNNTFTGFQYAHRLPFPFKNFFAIE